MPGPTTLYQCRGWSDCDYFERLFEEVMRRDLEDAEWLFLIQHQRDCREMHGHRGEPPDPAYGPASLDDVVARALLQAGACSDAREVLPVADAKRPEGSSARPLRSDLA